jgi:hypothetical protein
VVEESNLFWDRDGQKSALYNWNWREVGMMMRVNLWVVLRGKKMKSAFKRKAKKAIEEYHVYVVSLGQANIFKKPMKG